MGGSCIGFEQRIAHSGGGDILEVVHERASKGFLFLCPVRISVFGFSVELCIHIYIFVIQSANDRSCDGQSAIMVTGK